MNTDNPASHLVEQQDLERTEPAAARPAIGARPETELPYQSRAQSREISSEAEPATDINGHHNDLQASLDPVEMPTGQTRQEHFQELNRGVDAPSAGQHAANTSTEQSAIDPIASDTSESRSGHFEDVTALDDQTTSVVDGPADSASDGMFTADEASGPDDPNDLPRTGPPDDRDPPGDINAEPAADDDQSPTETLDDEGPASDREIVCGDDQAAVEPLDDQDLRDFTSYREQLETDGKTRQVTKAGDEYDYQRQYCGDTEYRITPDADLPRSAWADGLNNELGLAQDAKYVKSDSRSWFVPESMPPAMQGLAEEVMDKRLIKYRDVINDNTNPVRGLEIIVNSVAAAQAVAARMNALQVPGIVRVRPLGD